MSVSKTPCKGCGGRIHYGAKLCKGCVDRRMGRVPLIAPEIDAPPLTSFEDGWEQWMRTLGMAKDRYKGAKKDAHRTHGRRKILVIPDLHVPFHEAGMLADMLVRDGDADHAVCIGDIGDGYALSKYLQYASVPYADEWSAVTAVMQTLSETFPTTDLIIGNHDVRLEKQLRGHLTLDMVEAIKCMTGGVLCPITALAQRFSNITVAKHVTPGGHIVDWFCTVGDAWLGHPEKYSRIPGSALRGVEEWLADNMTAFGLDKYRLIVMGHTHAMSWFPWRSEQLLVECGCLCQQQGYMTSPRIGGRPQRRGYVTFEQVAGITDLNSVRMVWLDAA